MSDLVAPARRGRPAPLRLTWTELEAVREAMASVEAGDVLETFNGDGRRVRAFARALAKLRDAR